MDPELVFYECDQCHLEEGRGWLLCRGTPPSIDITQWEFAQIDQWECSICPDWPMRGQYLGSNTLIGELRQVVVVGRDHSPINHSTSCLQIRLGRPLGTKLFHWFAHLFISAANFLKIDLQPFPARVGTLIPFQIDLNAFPRQRFEKAQEQAECRLVR